MVPMDKIAVPRDAARAAAAPSRLAMAITAVGTYTDPAHNPVIETSK